MYAVLTFRSGAQVRFQTNRIKTGRSPLTNELSRIEWETPAGATSELHMVANLAEVVCVHIEHDGEAS